MAAGFKQLRRSYGFDEVAIVPGDITVNPDQTNTDFIIGDFTFSIPIVASAMDGVTDVNFVIEMSKLGGLAILNLDGVQARYEKPAEILDKIAETPVEEVTALLQKIYTEPIKENLVGERVQAVKKAEGISNTNIVEIAAGLLEVKVRKEKEIREQAYSEGREEGLEEGYDLAESLHKVVYPCSGCGKPIESDTPEEKEAASTYMREHGWGHRDCINRRR